MAITGMPPVARMIDAAADDPCTATSHVAPSL